MTPISYPGLPWYMVAHRLADGSYRVTDGDHETIVAQRREIRRAIAQVENDRRRAFAPSTDPTLSAESLKGRASA